MKHLKTLVLLAIFTVGLGGVANAQKVGHIDTDKLIANMPATKAMELEIKKMQKSYKDDVDKLIKAYQDKLQKYSAEEKAQTPATNEARKQELQQDAAKAQQAEKFAGEELQKKYNELLKPILEAAQKAIKEVANEKSVIYVLDAKAGSGLLIFEKGLDLYEDVKKKLGFL